MCVCGGGGGLISCHSRLENYVNENLWVMKVGRGEMSFLSN